MARIILHCDLNNYFASMEINRYPEYRGKPLAVCGNIAERHGIVLAKNNVAKSMGIVTGEAVVHAVQKCPNLKTVPPHYDDYVDCSRKIIDIYCKYTNLVESFGIDECWLDITDSTKSFAVGEETAHKLQTEVKQKFNLTMSIGVSYNKMFAKLGSDMKKPDAVTVITPENYKDLIWALPAGDLMGVGRNSSKNLKRRGIKTIGQLAGLDPSMLELWFGKNGLQMWVYANGLDNAPVMRVDFSPPIKSIGHGITTTEDLRKDEDVSDIFMELSQIIGYKLRKSNLAAAGVAIAVRDSKLAYCEYQSQLPYSTQASFVLAKHAKQLFKKNYLWRNKIRSLTVRAINLIPAESPQQLNMFTDYEYQTKLEAVDATMDGVRARYGVHSINSATFLKNIKIIKDKTSAQTPMTMFM